MASARGGCEEGGRAGGREGPPEGLSGRLYHGTCQTHHGQVKHGVTPPQSREQGGKSPPCECAVVILAGELAVEAGDSFPWLLLDQDELTIRGLVSPAVFRKR